jgi:hypothetical protein
MERKALKAGEFAQISASERRHQGAGFERR